MPSQVVSNPVTVVVATAPTFISHSTKDLRRARLISRLLAAAGMMPFLAHEDIRPSTRWRAEIKRNLATCAGFVALLTRNFKTSDWCDQEAGYIVSRPTVHVLSIRISRASYGFLDEFQDFRWDTHRRSSDRRNLERLLTALRELGWVSSTSMLHGLKSCKDLPIIGIVSRAVHDGPKLTPQEGQLLAEAILANKRLRRSPAANSIFPGKLSAVFDKLPESVQRKLGDIGFGPVMH